MADMKYICVTDREVQNGYCALCTAAVKTPYLREIATRLLYCDTACYWGHCHVALLAIEHHARRVS